MEAQGVLKGVARDLVTNNWMVTFEIKSLPSLEDISGGDTLDISAVRHREKRSLNANAYFHVLCTRIAERTGSTMTHEKNSLIRDCGYWFFIDGKIPTIMMKPDYEDEMLDYEGLHVKIVERHPDYIKLAFLRGSHTYNSVEMSHLIDLTVEAAKALGIETMTPDQIERMVAAWTGKN